MVQTYVVRSRYWFIASVFFFCCLPSLSAQLDVAERCWVFYRDKHTCTFDPKAYFDPKALLRREREGLVGLDSTDFPVNASYIEKVKTYSTTYVSESRWFNASVCYLTQTQQNAIAELAFVTEVRPIGLLPISTCVKSALGFDQTLLQAQTEIMGYPLFADKGLNGKGVTIAVFDAGFKGVPTHPELKHLVDRNQIKGTYNIVLDRNFVFDYHSHGTMVLSCMAGIYQDTPMGCAPHANYLLLRTEQTMSESKIEEDHWVRSLEWADKYGADIVNSSLGYNVQLYTRAEMSGHTHLMAKAANTAFSKGILVVNSAGNDGQNWWEIVAAPGDADSVLTVGGIDPMSGIHHPMSSYGPNTSGQLKPNVSAFFQAVVCSANGVTTAEGTSFSSPLVAGFAACVMQLHPEWPVKKVYDEIQKSAHLFPYYDYAHGYGIPQAAYFLEKTDSLPTALNADSLPQADQQEPHRTFDFIYHADKNLYRIQLCEPSEQENTFLSEASDTLRHFVYYQWYDEQGAMRVYQVVLPEGFDGAVLESNACDDCLIKAHYKGYTATTTRKKMRELAQKNDEKK
jgi:serine protease AprX